MNSIKYFRSELGWTQEVLGKEAGLSPNTIILYERNRRSPRLREVKKIATALGRSVYDLIDPDGGLEESKIPRRT